MENIILVDMSLTLIHHGHIRLLKKASNLGKVVVALTTDEEILKYKGYIPELNYKQRKEILLAIKFVDSVIPSPWHIDFEFFKKTKATFLVHGEDNSNDIPKKYLKLFPRTKNISSSILRERVLSAIKQKKIFRDC